MSETDDATPRPPYPHRPPPEVIREFNDRGLQKERELMEVVFEKARKSKFREKEEFADAGPTIAQQIAAEGEARGEARGVRSALRRVLETRFEEIPAEIDDALAGADVGTLDCWLTRALTATTLDETGILTDRPR
jgi:hypothetical protein